MIEPDTLLIVETRSGLAALRYVELLNKLVESEHLLLRARIPAQQRKEVDDCLGEISLLAETVRHLACLRIVPLQREHGEAQAVAVALAQLALPSGLSSRGRCAKRGIVSSQPKAL